jgi:hypothetical protein
MLKNIDTIKKSVAKNKKKQSEETHKAITMKEVVNAKQILLHLIY